MRDMRLGQILTTVEVKAEWLLVWDIALPSIAYLDQAIARTGSGVAIPPNTTMVSATFAVTKVTIAPLSLVHPLPRSSFFSLVNKCNLITKREVSMEIKHRVATLLHWVRAQTKIPEAAIKALFIIVFHRFHATGP